MITTEMTEGMSSIEVWVVMFAAAASTAEVERLALFFEEYVKIRHGAADDPYSGA